MSLHLVKDRSCITPLSPFPPYAPYSSIYVHIWSMWDVGMCTKIQTGENLPMQLTIYSSHGLTDNYQTYSKPGLDA